MLPAFSSRRLCVSTFPPPPPLQGSHFCIRGGRRWKNPGSFHGISGTPNTRLRPCALPPSRGPLASARLPAALPGRTRGKAPGAREAAQAVFAGHRDPARARRKSSLQGQARTPPTALGSANPSPTARLRCRARRRGKRTADREAPPALSASPRRAKFNFAGPRPLGAAGWGRAGPPTGSRAKPVRLPGPLIRRASLGARPRGVGGAGGGPGGCAARRLPTFPPPPHSRESPRAGPRARQCARAALPSTAGGGGGGQAGARGGARRRSRGRAAAAPGAAAAPRARSAGGPRGSPWAGFGPLRGEAFSRTGAPLLFRGTGGVHNPPCPIEHARPGRAGHRSGSGAWGGAKPSV